ncbi:hypothetical protein Tco_0623879 [Tanacetum coccineum]|uniref:Uncharacterized protein n=1 Tax=Tanacetum coccineum TaxID=301880 RepID=A0ABQ4WCG8_9ASTR
MPTPTPSTVWVFCRRMRHRLHGSPFYNSFLQRIRSNFRPEPSLLEPSLGKKGNFSWTTRRRRLQGSSGDSVPWRGSHAIATVQLIGLPQKNRSRQSSDSSEMIASFTIASEFIEIKRVLELDLKWTRSEPSTWMGKGRKEVDF